MAIANRPRKTSSVKAVGARVLRTHSLAGKIGGARRLSGAKDDILRFRVHPKQKQYWLKALAKLGVEDFSTYARAAVERAIAQDLRAAEPQWQEFIKAIQPKAKEILGVEVSDDPKDRLENMNEINEVLEKRHSKK